MADDNDHPASQRRFPPAVWIVPAALLALGLVLFLVLRGGGGGGIIGNGDGQTSVPPFFQVTRIFPIPVAGKPSGKITGADKEVAGNVSDVMNALYGEGFIDGSNWRGGSYDEVWPLFDEASQAAAQEQGATLTLGTTAASSFSDVRQPEGTVAVKILLARDHHPVTAVALVNFQALATGKNGTRTEIVSTGEYFLHPVDGTWKVYAFSVSRNDHQAAATPSGSASGTAGASS